MSSREESPQPTSRRSAVREFFSGGTGDARLEESLGAATAPGTWRDGEDDHAIDDSTVVLAPLEQGSGPGETKAFGPRSVIGPRGVVARFIGPAGVHDVSARSLADPDFTAMWRLWTHRDPRPAPPWP